MKLKNFVCFLILFVGVQEVALASDKQSSTLLNNKFNAHLVYDFTGLYKGSYASGSTGCLLKLTNGLSQALSKGSLVLAVPRQYNLLTPGFIETTAAAMPHGREVGEISGLTIRQIYIAQPEKYRFYQTQLPDLASQKEMVISLKLKMPGNFQPADDLVAFTRYTSADNKSYDSLEGLEMTAAKASSWTAAVFKVDRAFNPQSAMLGQSIRYSLKATNIGNGSTALDSFTISVHPEFTVEKIYILPNLPLTNGVKGQYPSVSLPSLLMAPNDSFQIDLIVKSQSAGRRTISFGTPGDYRMIDGPVMDAFDTIEITPLPIANEDITPHEVAWDKCRQQFTDQSQIKACVREKLLPLMQR